jgi:hypothetical protein
MNGASRFVEWERDSSFDKNIDEWALTSSLNGRMTIHEGRITFHQTGTCRFESNIIERTVIDQFMIRANPLHENNNKRN